MSLYQLLSVSLPLDLFSFGSAQSSSRLELFALLSVSLFLACLGFGVSISLSKLCHFLCLLMFHAVNLCLVSGEGVLFVLIGVGVSILSFVLKVPFFFVYFC